MLKIYQNENSKQVIISKEELQLNGWKELIAGSVDAAVNYVFKDFSVCMVE